MPTKKEFLTKPNQEDVKQKTTETSKKSCSLPSPAHFP